MDPGLRRDDDAFGLSKRHSGLTLRDPHGFHVSPKSNAHTLCQPS